MCSVNNCLTEPPKREGPPGSAMEANVQDRWYLGILKAGLDSRYLMTCNEAKLNFCFFSLALNWNKNCETFTVHVVLL